jgi:class 3 adenylate cyclase
MGVHFASTEIVQFYATTFGGPWASRDFRRAWFSEMASSVLAETPGGRDELRRIVDPEFVDLVDELQPTPTPPIWVENVGWESAGRDITGATVRIRVDHDDGRRAGTCVLSLGASGMSDLGRMVATADPRHLARMSVVERADRHPGAILMADLEASTPLARRMSSAGYFSFGRRLVRAADRCIIDTGGIVGRHAGDGVVAFFLAETAGSESNAARACIAAARDLRAALPAVAERSDLADASLALRFGLHWAATPYMGWIHTGGRSEVTALGDEVNETARIEACATGGRTLASKALLERLDHDDADALGLDLARMTYTPLVDLPTASDKARRDAPSISVTEV